MKKIAKGLLISISVILAIISLAFTIIEGRLLLSFDWSLHEQGLLGFVQYLARLGIAVLCLATSISSIVYINKKDFIFEGCCMLTVAIAIAINATNGVGLYLIIAGALYLAATVFEHFAPES